MSEIPLIAVVDDDAAIREAVQSLVRSVGLRAEVFASAQDFLQSGRLHDTACLIVDVRMPGMSGLELRDALRAEGRDSPVIFITAHGIDEIEEDLSMETVLAKPIEADLLVRAIDAAVSTRPSRPGRRARVGRR